MIYEIYTVGITRKRYARSRQQEQLFLEHKTVLGVIACDPYLGAYR
jgi:hypothetical protein